MTQVEKNLHCVYSAYSLCIRNEFSVNITVNLLCEVLREHFPFDVNKGKMFTENFTEKVPWDVHRDIHCVYTVNTLSIRSEYAVLSL